MYVSSSVPRFLSIISVICDIPLNARTVKRTLLVQQPFQIFWTTYSRYYWSIYLWDCVNLLNLPTLEMLLANQVAVNNYRYRCHQKNCFCSQKCDDAIHFTLLTNKLFYCFDTLYQNKFLILVFNQNQITTKNTHVHIYVL